MPRQSPFQHLHSFRRHLPLRRPDRLCRWAIIACHMIMVAPTAVSQAMRNVRPPRRGSRPSATARTFAMTSTITPGVPVASTPCAERDTHTDRISVTRCQLSSSATIMNRNGVFPARPDSAANLAGAARRGVRCPLGGHVSTGSGGKARWAALQKIIGSAKPASPLNRILERLQRADMTLRQAQDVRVAGARMRTLLPSARSTAGLRIT